MQVEFVNHSSFVAETGPIRLIADPWLTGRAFNNAWELLSATKFRHADFADITHIWFSHEHPDHFSPADLAQIPETLRAKIEVLYQRTRDKRVIKFCEKLGFRARELEPDVWTAIGPGVELLCCPVNADSWLAMRTPDATLLNTNDCFLSEEELHRMRRVGSIDVLFTQFSYAAWQGNPDDEGPRRARARKRIEAVLSQTKILDPKFVVPFASFVWFCNEENCYLNADMNHIHSVAESLRTETKAQPVVLYPGDRWRVGEVHDNQLSLDRYNEDYSDIEDETRRPRQKSASVSYDELLESSQTFFSKHYAHSRLAKRMLLALTSYRNRNDDDGYWRRAKSLAALVSLRVAPASVYVHDLERAFRLSLSGLRPCGLPKESCDISLSADSLKYCFDFGWGGETLRINGRYEGNATFRKKNGYPRSPDRFFVYFLLPRRDSFAKDTNLSAAANYLWKSTRRLVGVGE